MEFNLSPSERQDIKRFVANMPWLNPYDEKGVKTAFENEMINSWSLRNDLNTAVASLDVIRRELSQCKETQMMDPQSIMDPPKPNLLRILLGSAVVWIALRELIPKLKKVL